MEEEKKQKKLDDEGCTFTSRSCAAMEPYPLSKLNALGLFVRK